MTTAASVGGSERPRLFVALLLPTAAVQQLTRWQAEAFAGLRDVRIVPDANLHVTVAFLGHRPAAEVGPITEALRASAAAHVGRIELSVSRYRETRSVGMVAFDDAGGRAAAFAADLHGRLEQLDVYERERRRWLAHVTVLRFRRRPRLEPSLPDLGEVCPSEAAVYHSVLRPTGAQYEIVESVPLGAD